MLRDDIIEESSSPWLAPDVFICKKTVGTRICVDYQELNKRTVKDVYPLPRPNDVQDKFAGSVIFQSWICRVDICSFQYIKMTELKLYSGLGLFQFCKIPFGLSGAPALLQQLMDTILCDLSFFTAHLDDVLIYSANTEEHYCHLTKFLKDSKLLG